MADTFASFAGKVDRLTKDMTDDSLSHAMGKKAKELAKAAASADLGGDPKFSNWKPTLDTRYDIVGPGRISFHPSKRSAGPWTVAQTGRNQGNAGGFSGPGANRSTGATSRNKNGSLRKVRARKAKRWNGYTAGKQTASDAQAMIDKKLPPIGEEGFRKIVRKHFDMT